MIGLYDVSSSSPRWRHTTIGEQNKKEVKKGWCGIVLQQSAIVVIVMYGDGPTCVSAEIDACNQCVDYGGVRVSKDG